MIIESKMADAHPAPGKEGAGLNQRNEAGFGAVNSPRPAPSVKREPALGSFFVLLIYEGLASVVLGSAC